MLNNGNGNAAPPLSTLTASPTATVSIDTPSPTPEITSTLQPTVTPEASTSPAPTATPGPSVLALLAVWSNTTSDWVATALDQETSSYREGDFVPFLLRIDDAERGTTYDIELTYDCLVAGHHAFDFIAGLTPDEKDPLLTAPGPGRTTPDSSLIVPDDASIAFDDSTGATVLAYGATFSAASGPEPETECSDAKTLSLSVVAQDNTIMLIWTGHLASSEDWGEGSGASDATPFRIAVQINGEVQQIVTLLPGSVGP